MTTIDKTHSTTGTGYDTGLLWRAAAVTAVAAVLLPRLNAVLHQNQSIWELDPEAAVLAPLVVVVSLAVFALLGRRLWRARSIAAASLAVGVAAVLGLVFFWISAGIVLGGLAVTLGAEGLRRPGQRRGLAWTGVLLGGFAATLNAAVWLINF
ncbi:hypothetical protein [Nocardioides sp.]|uniref:hypothetical protein n=1 Tax=Nocardioides sp. TaxID=35761 RepID=UPI002ED2C975